LDKPPQRTSRHFDYINEFSTKTQTVTLELGLLNDIAYFLASRSTDVVAVTLRKDLPLTFILAKNRGMPDEKDIASARMFFSSMRDASTWKDVMPSIISYSADRINAALAALASFQFEGFISNEHHYVLGALNEEFGEPAAEHLADLFNTREPLDILERLFYRVRERASFEVDPNCTNNPDELEVQLAKFTALKATAVCLLNSTFLKKQVDMEADWALEYKRRVERVTIYVHGINRLIDRRRRCIKAGSDLPHVWLEYSDRETTHPELQPSDSARTAIKNFAGLLRSYEVVSKDDYHANPISSQLESQWISTINHVRHVVPGMVTCFDKDSDYTVNPRIIGTSTELCVCCAQWLKTYNDFMTYPKPPVWKVREPILSVNAGVDWSLGQRSSERSRRADDAVLGMLLKGVTRVLEDVGLLRKVKLRISARDNFEGDSASEYDSDSESDSDSEYEYGFGSPRR
jgi:hypothetical protein